MAHRYRLVPAPGQELVMRELAQDDGPANSVERLQLISDGTYATEQVTFRKKDILAADALDPFEATITWEQLDEWL